MLASVRKAMVLCNPAKMIRLDTQLHNFRYCKMCKVICGGKKSQNEDERKIFLEVNEK